MLRLAAAGSLVLALMVVGTQSGIVPPPTASEPPRAAAATPFEVPTQELAFVEFTDKGLQIYQTTVDRACPPSTLDCADITTSTRPLVSVPGALSASTVEVSQPNGNLALLTRDVLGNETLSVVLLQPRPAAGAKPQDPPPGASKPPPPATDEPRDPTPEPSARTPKPKPSQGESSVSPEPFEPSHGSDTPSAPSAPSSQLAPSPGITQESEAPPVSEPVPASDSPEPSVEIAVVQEILPDVHLRGAAPAWSADGEILAFSAISTERSGGPDLYTWRAGDVHARRVTSDQSTYFASWAGDRIVVSRPTLVPQKGAPDAVRARSAVIDLDSLEERSLRQDEHWLPQVDPAEKVAVVWRGELSLESQTAASEEGALYLINWDALDPFAPSPRTEPKPEPEPTPEPDTASPISSGPAGTKEPSDTMVPFTPSGIPGSPAPAEGTSLTSPHESASPALRSEKPEPSAEPRESNASSLSLEPVPVEPERDPATSPVRDWQVRWSDDGSAFGFWVTETPGAAWGQLAVVRMARDGLMDPATELLPPTLARRAFTLGLDRVAWIAPASERVDGELRLRTWGPRGYGGLRISEIEVRSGTPAF